MSKTVSIDALRKDSRNLNKGSGRGRRAVKESLQNYGVGRSIVLDVHGNVVCGNTTYQAALESGVDDVIVIESSGDKLIAHKRLDLDLTEKHGKARQLSIADNAAGNHGFNLDLTGLAEELRSGLTLPDSILTADEVSAMLAAQVESAALAADLEGGQVFGGSVPTAPGACDSPDVEVSADRCCPACGHRLS